MPDETTPINETNQAGSGENKDGGVAPAATIPDAPAATEPAPSSIELEPIPAEPQPVSTMPTPESASAQPTASEEHSNILQNVGMSSRMENAAAAPPQPTPTTPTPEPPKIFSKVEPPREVQPLPQTAPTPSPKSFLAKALETIQFRKRAKLGKIMKLAKEKRAITNAHVQKLLRVSDATATRYLTELVRQNRLKQFGIRGSARYEPIIGSIGGN